MAPSPDLISATSSLLCTEDASSILGDQPNTAVWAPLSPPLHGGPILSDLLAAESDRLPLPDYLPRLLSRSLDPTARQDAVNWILQLNSFHNFSPVTACLAVSYLDRFLSSNSLEFPWAMQLLAVACVSVAAKMEETHVPALVDLQVFDSSFVFESKIVARMELFLLSRLGWRMWAITPFDFFELMAGVAGQPELFSRAANLILNTHRVVDFLAYRPSSIAAAALHCALVEVDSGVNQCSALVEVGSGVNHELVAFLDEWMTKDAVRSCRRLMEEYLIDTCPSPPVPESPIGVLDAAACGSCDSHKSAAAENAEPPSKRLRLGG